jgi:hypothetical protein
MLTRVTFESSDSAGEKAILGVVGASERSVDVAADDVVDDVIAEALKLIPIFVTVTLYPSGDDTAT